jgi:hypothetical protein
VARLRRPADPEPEPEPDRTLPLSQREPYAGLRVVPGGGEWTLDEWRAALYGGSHSALASVPLPDDAGPGDTAADGRGR